VFDRAACPQRHSHRAGKSPVAQLDGDRADRVQPAAHWRVPLSQGP
jgi:hypothetical protein